MSNLVSSLLLISIAIGCSVTVYEAFNGLASASNQPTVNLQVNGGKLVQGTNQATLSISLVNLGSQPTTSLAISLNGVQSSLSSFSATSTLTSLPSGTQVYSGSFVVLPNSSAISYSFNAVLNPNQSVDLAITFAPSIQGAALFTSENTYDLVLSAQPFSQASVLLTASSP